jgi:antitoxin ParD1/3/4
MTTLEISLPEPLKAFIDQQVAAGPYRDASEYLQTLLRDACEAAQRRAEIDAELLKGMEALERGECSEMTAQDWQRLRTEYLERARKRNAS